MSRFNWDSETTFLKEKLPPDLLDRAKHASFLTKTINNEVNPNRGGDIDSIKSHVLNLNADWGAGKTYFLKRWANSLKQDHPVVYIDTWSTDYLESPLITVLTELLEQLKEQTSKKGTESAIEKADNVLKKAAPKVASAVMKKFLGFDLSVFSSGSEAETTDTKCNDASNPSENKKNEINFAAAGEAILSQFYSEHKSHKQNVEALSKSIKDWVKLVKENPVDTSRTAIIDYPAYIFIDELDRCKPTYAVEMLEAIKHVFDIPGLVFVVATNTKELQHTIKAVYGVGFNAESYLNRFFDSKYFIRTSLSAEMLSTHCDLHFLEPAFLSEKEILLFPFVEEAKVKLLSFAVSLFNAYEIAPREAIKILNRFKFLVISHEKTVLDASLLLLMITLLSHSKGLYDDFLKRIETREFTNFDIHASRREISQVFNNIKIDYYNEKLIDKLISDVEQIDKRSVSYFSYPRAMNFTYVLAELGERKYESLEKLIGAMRSSEGKRAGRSRQDFELLIQILKHTCEVNVDIDKYKDVVELANNLDMA
ncbi:hypothetical protein HJP15_19075 [Pseudoalteromonas sp. NEC-BIFX-2020_002]|uniref:KAP family P-loop NTPase fold protein n=1 Tax=Pseudoalteromonas sp. NEC-BIFX-2020_002 TaxID=2732353 RepID=UPI00147773E7|nr:P-loop NTPase fold protein [Pseudoalteromonas sp. NEC-BIFX-2020_002]NNG44995.1 hypothetical protein [Pseudoalteromonas sp. NEC-BIFX-2020_002]